MGTILTTHFKDKEAETGVDEGTSKFTEEEMHSDRLNQEPVLGTTASGESTSLTPHHMRGLLKFLMKGNFY